MASSGTWPHEAARGRMAPRCSTLRARGNMVSRWVTVCAHAPLGEGGTADEQRLDGTAG